MRWLPKIQIAAGTTLDDSWCYPRKSFDKQSMLWDLNYFKYYFPDAGRHRVSTKKASRRISGSSPTICSAPRGNTSSAATSNRATSCSRTASLISSTTRAGRRRRSSTTSRLSFSDAKADVPFDLRDELLDLYHHGGGKARHRSIGAEFKEAFPGFVLIRIMQAMGAYGLRGFHEKKPFFLQSIPYAIRNIEHVL